MFLLRFDIDFCLVRGTIVFYALVSNGYEYFMFNICELFEFRDIYVEYEGGSFRLLTWKATRTLSKVSLRLTTVTFCASRFFWCIWQKITWILTNMEKVNFVCSTCIIFGGEFRISLWSHKHKSRWSFWSATEVRKLEATEKNLRFCVGRSWEP